VSEDLNRPDLTLTVIRDGEPYTIKMTYGLEMDIRRVMPDPSTAAQLAMVDPHTQDYVVRRCLTDLKKTVHDDAELVQAEDVDIDTEDADRIVLWALEHQLYFFGKRARGVMTLAARQQTKLPPHLTTDGSEDSPLKTPSAGPSESSKETSTDSSGDTPAES
jgi:hypothetical protein